MTPSRSSPRSISRALRACSLALLGLGLLAPTTARAAHCGRYVLGQARFERELAQVLEGEPGQSPAMPAPPPAPCDGPSCSGQPAAPSAPVATPTPTVEDRACPPAPPTVQALPSLATEPDEADPRPVHRGLSVFHPPRHTSA